MSSETGTLESSNRPCNDRIGRVGRSRVEGGSSDGYSAGTEGAWLLAEGVGWLAARGGYSGLDGEVRVWLGRRGLQVSRNVLVSGVGGRQVSVRFLFAEFGGGRLEERFC